MGFGLSLLIKGVHTSRRPVQQECGRNIFVALTIELVTVFISSHKSIDAAIVAVLYTPLSVGWIPCTRRICIESSQVTNSSIHTCRLPLIFIPRPCGYRMMLMSIISCRTMMRFFMMRLFISMIGRSSRTTCTDSGPGAFISLRFSSAR